MVTGETVLLSEAADTITSLLLSAYKMSNTSDQNDNDMIAALGDRLTLITE